MSELLIKLGIGAAILMALLFGEQYIEGIGAGKQSKIDTVAMDDLKIEAARVLKVETDKADALTAKMQQFVNTQNLKDSDHEKTVRQLSGKLRDLASANDGRLWDPNTSGCGDSSLAAQSKDAGASSDRPADGAQAGGPLSTELSGLLQRLTLEADTINDAYISCRADSVQLRASDTP